MARNETVTVRVNSAEDTKLEKVAEFMRRSKSDALRVLVEEKYEAITAKAANTVQESARVSA